MTQEQMGLQTKVISFHFIGNDPITIYGGKNLYYKSRPCSSSSHAILPDPDRSTVRGMQFANKHREAQMTPPPNLGGGSVSAAVVTTRGGAKGESWALATSSLPLGLQLYISRRPPRRTRCSFADKRGKPQRSTSLGFFDPPEEDGGEEACDTRGR